MIRISHFIFKHCTLYKLRHTRKYTHSYKIHAEACGYAPQNAKPELNATMFFSDLMCVAMLPKYTHLVQRTNWRHADIGTYYRKAPDKLFSGKVKKYILVQWACSMWLYNFVIFIAPKMTECISIFRTIFSYYVEFTLAIPSVSLKLWSISFFRYLRCYHCSRVQFLCNVECELRRLVEKWKSGITDWLDRLLQQSFGAGEKVGEVKTCKWKWPKRMNGTRETWSHDRCWQTLKESTPFWSCFLTFQCANSLMY